MTTADVKLLTWSRLNTISWRCRASAPMSTLLRSHIIRERVATLARDWFVCHF
jgi:hypothetical protein